MQRQSKTGESFDEMAKLALIGDSSVGKTNILLRYIHSEINLNHIATIGIDFKIKLVDVDGFKLKMQIWDTAGQQRFRNLTGTVYQGAQAILLVYSVTDRKTFLNLTKWIEEVNNNAASDVVIALAGNKTDLEEERVVSVEQGKAIAAKFGNCIFFETSAKNGTNINDLFDSICRKIKDKLIAKRKNSAIKNPKPQQTKSQQSTTQAQKTQKQKSAQKPVKLKNPSKEQKQKKKGCC